jgi:phosphoglycerol transferase
VIEINRKATVETVLAAVLPFVALALLLPQIFSLHVPLAYGGDGLSHAVLVKSVLEVGWFPAHNPRLGAPFGATWFDYPYADAANLLLLKIIGVISSDWIVATNLFYLATFALTSAASFLVLRRFGLEWGYALIAAMLFAVLPYHFLRSDHLLLAAYWSVPIGVYLATMCGPQAADMRSRGFSAEPWQRVLMAIAVACGGIYYAFFTVVLVAASGLAGVFAERRWRAMLPAIGSAAIIVATICVEIAPNFYYWYQNGTNERVARRSAAEAELFAFKPFQLLLPHSQHRIARAREIANGYARSTPLVNENATASLGVIGAIGLVLALAYGLRRVVAERPFDPPLESLALQSVAALAVGTVGGAGSLFAHLGFTSIRAYNRISVFLGFIGLAAAFLLLQRILPRIRDPRTRAGVGTLVAVALAILGSLDQLPVSTHALSVELDGDRRFFASVEHSLAPGTAVYQLPYHPYPEAGPMYAMDDYSLARGYLNTDTLRWSYGAMKGRLGDVWLRSLAEHGLTTQLDLAARSGFGAVYVDRRGYPDHGAAVESVLRHQLGDPIATSQDANLVAYSMRPTGTSPVPLAMLLPEWETPIRFDREVLSPRVSRLTGFSITEPAGRWTNRGLARVEFLTPLPRRFVLRLETSAAMPPSANVDLPVRVGDVIHNVRVGSGRTIVETEFDLPADASFIEIRIPRPSSPRDLDMGSDTRMLGIHVSSITILPR